LFLQPLGRKEIASIVEIQAAYLVSDWTTGASPLRATPGARELRAREGYDPGVRGAHAQADHQAHDTRIARPRAASTGTFGECDTVVVDAKGDTITFRKR